MQGFDFGAHGHAQFGVEVRQGLVKQEHLGVSHNGAAHGHALALTAREFAGVTLEQGVQVQNAGGVGHTVFGGFGIGFAQAQRKRHVFAHRHVRIKRIALKHHGNVAIFGLEVVDDGVVNADFASRDFL